MWGAIRHLRLLKGTVVVSGGAGQFRVIDHAARWVHSERLVRKLRQRYRAPRTLEVTRLLIWWFCADLKVYRLAPHPKRAALRARFDRIFGRAKDFALLDQLLRRLRKQRAEWLRVLDRPEIPLHTNGSENEIRAFFAERKVSAGAVSEASRQGRHVQLGLVKTSQKLGVSFSQFLGARLGIEGAPPPLLLEDLVRAAVR